MSCGSLASPAWRCGSAFSVHANFVSFLPKGKPVLTSTFDKHEYRSPEPSTSPEFLPLMLHLWVSYPFNELEARYADACKDLRNLRWRFREHQLYTLHSMLSAIPVFSRLGD